jgi:hypothetical protein
VPRALPAPGGELAEIVLVVDPAADADDAEKSVNPAINIADVAPRTKNLDKADRADR